MLDLWIFLFIKNPDNNNNNTNVYWVIFEGSCDTEDCNDAENAAVIIGINYILKYIQTESYYFK